MPPSKKPDWIDWRNSKARKIILDDLLPGGLLYQQDNLLPQVVFAFYKTLPEFKDVVYDQFAVRFKGHRQQANRDQAIAKRDEIAMERDRRLITRQYRNQRGELVFDMHPAKSLLREDIKKGLHKNTTPFAFQQTRDEYQLFKTNIFRKRIYQEERRNKWLNYLEKKRLEKSNKGHSLTAGDVDELSKRFASLVT